LRRLMDSPGTSQKRKRGAYEDISMGNGGNARDETEENMDIRSTPTKKLKASGSFEPALKRKENSLARENSDTRNGQRSDFKRRKIWPGTT
jgi:hypothetical protein